MVGQPPAFAAALYAPQKRGRPLGLRPPTSHQHRQSRSPLGSGGGAGGNPPCLLPPRRAPCCRSLVALFPSPRFFTGNFRFISPQKTVGHTFVHSSLPLPDAFCMLLLFCGGPTSHVVSPAPPLLDTNSNNRFSRAFINAKQINTSFRTLALSLATLALS